MVFSDGVVRVGGEKVEGHTGTAATRTACAGYIVYIVGGVGGMGGMGGGGRGVPLTRAAPTTCTCVGLLTAALLCVGTGDEYVLK